MRLLQTLAISENSGSGTYALKQGLDALARDRPREALAWLQRACRLAPNNAAMRLFYASSLMGHDDREAETQLQAIVSSHATAWSAMRLLAIQAYRGGDADRAANLLTGMLSRSASPPDAPFRAFVGQVTAACGKPGWAGLSSDGKICFSTTAEFRLDGRRIRPPAAQAEGLFFAMLPKSWRRARNLDVTQHDSHLLGSPFDLDALTRVQGFVEFDREQTGPGLAVRGWAWLPGCPDIEPSLQIFAGRPQSLIRSIVAADSEYRPPDSDGLSRPRGFRAALATGEIAASIRVVDLLGRDLFGSPLSMVARRAESRPARKSLSAKARNSAIVDQPAQLSQIRDTARAGASPPVYVIIPVFNGADDLRACLASLQRSQAGNYRLIIVDDASTSGAVQHVLTEAMHAGAEILRQPRNKGFPAAANAGLRYTLASDNASADVVLLNPDTLVSRGWLDGLRSAAYADADIGSVTPMTNDGSILSYPSAGETHAPAGQTETDALGRLFEEANPGVRVEIPTAIGFCMYIKRTCLFATGLFREDVFAQGYGEENDWSVRARHLGWRHIADAATFVSHAGGRSFGAARKDLLARNLRILDYLHPEYSDTISRFLAADPIQAVRRTADLVRWREATAKPGAVILITHRLGGGVERHIRTRCKAIRRQGLRPIVLRPPKEAITSDPPSHLCHVGEEDEAAFPNLLFSWRTNLTALLELLRTEGPKWIEIHHHIGHDPQVLSLPDMLALPYDLVLHDYASVCPRISMCSDSETYCGSQTDARVCDACVAKNGNRLPESISPASLRRRTVQLVTGARRTIAPSDDTAHRFSRYIPGARLLVQPWEDDLQLSRNVKPVAIRNEQDDVQICVVGGIGEEKGYQVLLACARDAARRELPLSFKVVGHTIDDSSLIDTKKVFITGYYTEDERDDLIRAQSADIGFLPSVWPETWCYALSALWRADLWPVVFDIGAHAERVKQSRKGTVLTAGLSAKKINDGLRVIACGQRPTGSDHLSAA